jgi:hypothetical protein
MSEDDDEFASSDIPLAIMDEDEVFDRFPSKDPTSERWRHPSKYNEMCCRDLTKWYVLLIQNYVNYPDVN